MNEVQLREYKITLRKGVVELDNQPLETVVIQALDFEHAVSEAMDEFGKNNILSIAQSTD
jgi:hypothetical protein